MRKLGSIKNSDILSGIVSIQLDPQLPLEDKSHKAGEFIISVVERYTQFSRKLIADSYIDIIKNYPPIKNMSVLSSKLTRPPSTMFINSYKTAVLEFLRAQLGHRPIFFQKAFIRMLINSHTNRADEILSLEEIFLEYIKEITEV